MCCQMGVLPKDGQVLMCDSSKGCRMVKACTSSGLLKELPLQDAQTRLVSGKEARVPEPLHLPSGAATSRKGHRRRGRTLGDSWKLSKCGPRGSDGEASEARLKPLGSRRASGAPAPRPEQENGWACMCSRVAVSSETGISCLAPRRSSDKAP